MADEHLLMDADDSTFQSAYKLVETKIGALLESMPDGIIITDSSGKIVSANNQAEKQFGYADGALVSLMIETLLPQRFRERHVSQRDSYVRNPHPRPMGQGKKLRGLRKDGREFPVRRQNY